MLSLSRLLAHFFGALSALAVFAFSSTALAVDFDWNTGTGDWNTSGNWTPAGPPNGGGGNFARINNGGTAQITGVVPSVQDYLIGNVGAGSGTIEQSAGVNSVTGWVRVGVNAGSNGTYTVSGGSITAGRFNFGENGTGTLEVEGTGSVIIPNSSAGTLAGALVLGGAGGSTGNLDISGGTVTIGGDTSAGPTGNNSLLVGNGGTGMVTLSGGTLTASAGDVRIGNGGVGSVTQTGGTADFHPGGNGNWTFVGLTSNGTYSISGGTLTEPNRLVIGNNNGVTGTFSQSQPGPGATTVTVGRVEVGDSGIGNLNISGGTFTINGDGANRSLVVAQNASASTSQVTLSGGTLTAVAGDVMIGEGGTATFTHTGGTADFHAAPNANWTFIGNGSTGNYNMSGPGSPVLTEGNRLEVGYGGGTGTFTQDAGSVSVGGTNTGNGLIIGGDNGTNATGTYHLNGGTLTASRITELSAGAGSSTFNFNGGTLRPSVNNATFMQGLDRANVRNGGAIIDTNGFDITIAQVLEHSNIMGDAAIDGGLTKNGAGILTLSGNNNAGYTGATQINAGTLRMGTGSNIPDGSAVTLANVAGATLDLNGNSETIGSLAGGGATGGNVTLGAGTLTTGGNNTTTTYSGVISGSGGLNKVGTGTMTLTNANTHTGNTQVNGGVLRLTVGGKLNGNASTEIWTGETANGNLHVDGGAIGDVTAPAWVAIGRSTVGTATLSSGSITTQRLSLGSIAAGADGTFDVLGGTLNISTESRIGETGVGTLNISGAADVNASGQFRIGFGAAAGRGLVTVANTSTLDVGSLFVGESGVGAIRQSGGTVTDANDAVESRVGANANSYGSYRISSGTLNANSTFQVGAFGAGSFVQTGGDVNFAANTWPAVGRFTSGTGAMNLSGGNLTQDGNGTSLIIAEQGRGELNISGTANVTVNSTLGLRIAQAASGVGIVNLNGGTLSVHNVSDPAGLSQFDFNGGTLRALASNATFMQGLDNVVVNAGGANINTNGFDITIAQPLLAPAGQGLTSIALGAAGSNYMGPPLVQITGGGGSGATAVATIDEGTGQVTGFVITNPGTGYTSAPTVTLVGGGGGGASAGAVSLAANVSGGLTKNGSGTLTLSGANTYTGVTQINAGTLSLAGGAAIFDTGGNVNLANVAGATLNLANSETIGALSGGGTTGGNVTLNANTLTTGANNNSTTYSGVISGSGGLNKVGTGTMTLTNANTHTGTTQVNGGVLRLTAGGTLNGNASTEIWTGQTGNGNLHVDGGAIGNVTAPAWVAIGRSTVGTGTLSSGSITTQRLSLGSIAAGADGTLDITGGTLTVSTETRIGETGTGEVNHSGGTVNNNTALQLAFNVGSTGTYNLNGGTLNVTGNISNPGGASTLNIDGGTLNMSTNGSDITVDTLRIGHLANGAYSNLGTRTITIQPNGEFVVGNNATGTFTQNGGTVDANNNNGLKLGLGTGSGTVNHQSGNIDASWVEVGSQASTGTGDYNLSGGNLNITNELQVGRNSAGNTFDQTGGAVTGAWLDIGRNATGGGTYDLSAGTATFSGPANAAGNTVVAVGGDGTGELIVRGTGMFSSTGGETHLGALANGVGTLRVEDSGSFSAFSLRVGSLGDGYVFQSGGTMTSANWIAIGEVAGSFGQYNLSGGTATAVGQQTIVGVSGIGELNVSGGTLNTPDLSVGLNNGSVGTVTQTGGTINVTNPTTYRVAAANTADGLGALGSAGTGTVLHSGGTTNVTGNMLIGNGQVGGGDGTGSYTLSDSGVLDFGDTTGATGHHTGNTNPSTLRINSDGAFNFQGGTLQNVTTILPLSNGNTFTQDGGRFYIGEDEPNGSMLAIENQSARTTTIQGSFLMNAGDLYFDTFGPEATPHDMSDLEPTDLLMVEGLADLDGVLHLTFDGFLPEFGDIFTLVKADMIVTGDDFSLDGGFLRIVSNGPGMGYSLQAIVPEPGTVAMWSLLALAAGGFAMRMRGRRRK